MKISEELILSREPATQETPLTNGKQAPLTGVELVLVDPDTLINPIGPAGQATWYRCSFPDCGEAYPSSRSALAHLVKHSPKRRAAKAEREAAELKAAKAASFTRRSAGMKTATQARETRRRELKKSTPQQLLLEISAELRVLDTKLRDVAAIFEAPKSVVSDEELAVLREKASQYDIIKSALK
jgi:hypothetical protein